MISHFAPTLLTLLSMAALGYLGYLWGTIHERRRWKSVVDVLSQPSEQDLLEWKR